MLWEKAEQIDTNKCEDIKYYLAAIAKHEVINERNKFVRMLNWIENVIGNSDKSICGYRVTRGNIFCTSTVENRISDYIVEILLSGKS